MCDTRTSIPTPTHCLSNVCIPQETEIYKGLRLCKGRVQYLHYLGLKMYVIMIVGRIVLPARL